MEWLVLLHVVSAVLGLGPAYAFPLLLNNAPTVHEMQRNLSVVTRMEIFPKIFGTLALLSGLALFWLGSYGPFMQIWIAGTLLVYALIEIVVIGLLNPTATKLLAAIGKLDSGEKEAQPASELQMSYSRVRNYHIWSCALGLIIFAFMVIKP
ncbi:DUF2269 family protein [Cohnella cholangitidis]|nr:DUF2269 family protein [Cohnella cholangitidis]